MRLGTRISAVILCILSVMQVTACGKIKEDIPKSERPAVEEAQETNADELEKSPGNVKDLEIASCEVFSDSAAWVIVKEGTSEYLIDTEGNIILDPEDLDYKLGYYNTTNFYDGTALAYIAYPDAKDTTNTVNKYANSIIDKQGNIIWSVEKEGWEEAEKYFTDTEVTGVSGITALEYGYYGYMAVEYKVDSYDYTGSYVGILDSDGKWVVEPNKPCEDIGFDGPFKNSEKYCVTSAFAVDYETGEVIMLEEGADPGTVADAIETEKFFADHNGLIFDLGPNDQDGFYDQSGNFVIDLYAMGARSEEDPVFVDGYAIIELENEQESRYLTVIDTAGNQMFDPIKNTGHGALSEGKFFWEEGGCYLDVNGNQVGDVTGIQGMTFNDGRAWICTEDQEWVCIDDQGNIVF